MRQYDIYIEHDNIEVTAIYTRTKIRYFRNSFLEKKFTCEYGGSHDVCRSGHGDVMIAINTTMRSASDGE